MISQLRTDAGVAGHYDKAASSDQTQSQAETVPCRHAVVSSSQTSCYTETAVGVVEDCPGLSDLVSVEDVVRDTVSTELSELVTTAAETPSTESGVSSVGDSSTDCLVTASPDKDHVDQVTSATANTPTYHAGSLGQSSEALSSYTTEHCVNSHTSEPDDATPLSSLGRHISLTSKNCSSYICIGSQLVRILNDDSHSYNLTMIAAVSMAQNQPLRRPLAARRAVHLYGVSLN